MNEVQSNCAPTEHAVLVRKAIARRVSAFASAAKRVRCAEDTDATHDVRVCARSLDAMLRTWDCLFSAPVRKEALRALKRVRRRLGGARELQVHVSLLEPRAWQHGEPAARLLQMLREKLSRRTLRAARLLRPKRLQHLLASLEPASSDTGTVPDPTPHPLDRARARALETGAVARVALQLACEREDEWMLHQARIATKKWRYAIESVDGIVPVPEAQALSRLREIQEALGTFHDRATLMEAIARTCRNEERAGIQPVLDELEQEKQAAIREFKALAPSMNGAKPSVARTRRAAIRPRMAVTAAPVNGSTTASRNGAAHSAPRNGAAAAPVYGSAAAHDPGDAVATRERWERMAQWLVGTSAGK